MTNSEKNNPFMWNLNESNFTFFDRLKLCKFFLTKKNRWTMDNYVREFEHKMSLLTEQDNAIFVSSGSTANTLLAMYLREKSNGRKNKIIFPSTTWITSISPFIREGFEPVFIDINLENFSMDMNKLEDYVKLHNSEICCVFITSLLGFSADILSLKYIEKVYGVKIMMDNCECTFSSYDNSNINSYFTSTTSTYFGHQLQSVEGGFIFTSNQEEADYFLMMRNHGMVRSLDDDRKAKYENPIVDSKFDFYCLGNNFRNSNINAYIGLLDFNRIDDYIKIRKYLFNIYKENIDPKKYLIPKSVEHSDDVPFCLPIISKSKDSKNNALNLCCNLGIETRPILTGNLLKQTAFKRFGSMNDYPNSNLLDANGFYVGLHPKVSKSKLQLLINKLNKI